MKRLIHMFFLFFCFLFLFGCESKHETESKSEFTIYTSIYPLQYATERIAGELAEVKTVYPPGVDAHHYEPASRDIIDIAESDTFILIGGHTESFATTIKTALAKQKINIIELSQYETLFEEIDVEHEGHDHHDHDPHIWLDPLRMIQIGEIITNELTEQFSAYEQIFIKNFEHYKTDMLQLDEQFAQKLNNKETAYIIVTHAAYDYWEERYNIIQVPIRGRSNSDEPSQKDLIDVATIAKEHDIKHVFFEQNSDDYVSTIMLEHIGAEKLFLHNLEVRTEEEISNGEDYISLMEKNLAALLKALNKEG